MRRCLELIAFLGTAGLLVATSQARQPCASQTVNLRADTTCGPVANLAVTTTTNCSVTAAGADFGGLPTSGAILNNAFADAGIDVGFSLSGLTADGGNTRNCNARPSDAGFDILCTPTCGDLDAGACEASCSGTLTLQ